MEREIVIHLNSNFEKGHKVHCQNFFVGLKKEYIQTLTRHALNECS